MQECKFLGTTQWDVYNGLSNPASKLFRCRRARLKFSGFAYSPKLKYKLELGLSNRDIGKAFMHLQTYKLQNIF